MAIYAKLSDVRNLQRQAQHIQETMKQIIETQERIDKIVAEISEALRKEKN